MPAKRSAARQPGEPPRGRVRTPEPAELPVAPRPALSLASVLDMNAASPLRSLILMHRGQDLDLDAAEVERIGGLCLQVLLAARQTWTADQKTIRIINISGACRDALHLAQASAALGVEA